MIAISKCSVAVLYVGARSYTINILTLQVAFFFAGKILTMIHGCKRRLHCFQTLISIIVPGTAIDGSVHQYQALLLCHT